MQRQEMKIDRGEWQESAAVNRSPGKEALDFKRSRDGEALKFGLVDSSRDG